MITSLKVDTYTQVDIADRYEFKYLTFKSQGYHCQRVCTMMMAVSAVCVGKSDLLSITELSNKMHVTTNTDFDDYGMCIV